jgi:hypothetical protein
MNSRERRDGSDSMDLLIRQSLQDRAGGKTPRPVVRRNILARAARQQRRYSLRLPSAISGFLRDDYAPFTHHSTQNQLLYLEALFGPRMGGFSFNQLMR